MSITVWKATRKTNKKQLSMAQEKILATCLEFEKQTMKAWKYRASSAKFYSKHWDLLNCIAYLLYSRGQDDALQNLGWVSTKVNRTPEVSSVSTVKTTSFSSLTLNVFNPFLSLISLSMSLPQVFFVVILII